MLETCRDLRDDVKEHADGEKHRPMMPSLVRALISLELSCAQRRWRRERAGWSRCVMLKCS